MAGSPLHEDNGQRLAARKLVENQMLFESINEKLEALSHQIAAEDDEPDPSSISFLCECSNPACQERMTIPVARYRAIHAMPQRFSIRPGHEILSIERVIERYDDYGYEVVEKLEPLPA